MVPQILGPATDAFLTLGYAAHNVTTARTPMEHAKALIKLDEAIGDARTWVTAALDDGDNLHNDEWATEDTYYEWRDANTQFKPGEQVEIKVRWVMEGTTTVTIPDDGRLPAWYGHARSPADAIRYDFTTNDDLLALIDAYEAGMVGDAYVYTARTIDGDES